MGTVDGTVLHLWVCSACSACPDLPDRVACRVACDPQFNADRVSFNRRVRRKLFERLVPTLLSLLSGVQQWAKWPGQVLHIDLLSDLLSPDVFGMLLKASPQGSVDGLTAEPPCGTMSVLRMKKTGVLGPRQVRDKHGSGRFGRDGLSPNEQAAVDDDTILHMRTFLLMAVINA